MKKDYQTPAISVVLLQQQTMLLIGSDVYDRNVRFLDSNLNREEDDDDDLSLGGGSWYNAR